MCTNYRRNINHFKITCWKLICHSPSIELQWGNNAKVALLSIVVVQIFSQCHSGWFRILSCARSFSHQASLCGNSDKSHCHQLRRGVRSDVQLSCTETRFQKCSQSGKNGSKHPMLSISMAYNVISCKKVERNTQKLKIAHFTM